MQLTSPAFNNNSFLPKKYSCDGEGVNPPLIVSDVPESSKSLALVVTDPDAPMGTYIHWVVYNIPVETQEIGENSMLDGSVQGLTSAGKPGFVAACPPNGQHRYFFKLYALNVVLSAAPLLDKAGLEKAIEGHIVASSQLVGLYAR